jgi:hypothetical protein
MPIAFGGILNISSPTSVNGIADEIFNKRLDPNGANGVSISGSFTSAPNDSFGTVIFNLTAPFGPPNTPFTNSNLQFTAYVIDATHIQLIESDQALSTGFGSTAGIAIGQGSAAGSFSNASLSSGTSYVFGVLGMDLSTSAQDNGALPDTWTSAGLVESNGTGDLTAGYTDASLLYNTAEGTAINPQIGAQISAQITAGAYSVSPNGRAVLNNFVLSPEPRHGYRPTLFFYLTGMSGEGHPAALVLAAGDTSVGSVYYPSIGTGIAYQQSTAAPVFFGDYGLSFAQQNGTENDGTGQMNVNPANTPPLSGVADASNDGQDNDFLGTFSGPTSNVPFSGNLYANPDSTANANAFSVPIAVDYYYVDQDHGFWIETDLVSAFSGQVSLGYYATRTSLCSGCP